MKWINVFDLLKYRKRLLEYNCSSQKRELNIGIKRENPNFVECSDISVSCGLLKVVVLPNFWILCIVFNEVPTCRHPEDVFVCIFITIFFKTISFFNQQPQITVNNLNNALILVPSKKLENKFTQVIKGIYKKRLRIKEENDTLIEIRDVLLPKLMSGEIRVSL
ncbi:hypothetical protein HNQ35_001445 [Cerasibacillus quisquiliarum]|uniref:Type I restriction modification DNA specificity domain-containing protein n=1 Tax=Cerasibacillus quisquiliarum TaxID=227865 RepID=A0A511UWG8_9BACI|nr:hypothetical protein [Cerasibacillus quisquiliarum]MBB5146244.1 hypothetical protein [Cerasibacillus quisquiliarum]GEN30980.1 hypothetical protein CQU01_12180 [Cerasibacillus quisquiliarum]